MKSSIRIIVAALVVMISGSCAQQPSPVALSVATGAVQAPPPAFTCNPSAFLGRIEVYPSPVSLTDMMQTDLGNAYCNAPPFFKNHLDALDHIYIDSSACAGGDLKMCSLPPNQFGNSYGRRYPQSKEVMISAGLWNLNKPAPSYADYESSVLNYLIRWPTTPLPAFTHPASPTDPVNSSWMTVLAALAHEVGHIRWFEINVRNGYGKAYDFTTLNNCSFFSGWSNQQNKYLEPKGSNGRWRDFGDQQTRAGTRNDHTYHPTLADFDAARGTGQPFGPLLSNLFDPALPWPSYLGANAADEDFVETYKFAVLHNATPGLWTMPVNIPGGNPRDIPLHNYYFGSPLYNKVSCIVSLP